MIEIPQRIEKDFSYSDFTQFGDFMISCKGLEIDEICDIKDQGFYPTMEVGHWNGEGITYHFKKSKG